MARHCQKCGAEIPDGSPVCRACFEPIKPEGWLARLGRLFGIRLSVGPASPPAGTKLNIKFSEHIKIRNPLTGELHEYRSLDEVPEEFRELIRRAQETAAQGRGGIAITVSHTGGKTRTFHSVDELPPDLRALYEKARNRDSAGS